MSHIAEQYSPKLICNLPKPSIVDDPGVGGCPTNDDFGSESLSQCLHLLVVDETCGWVESVGECFKVLRHHADLLVRQLVPMTTPTENRSTDHIKNHLRWPPWGRSRARMRSWGWRREVYAWKLAGLPDRDCTFTPHSPPST